MTVTSVVYMLIAQDMERAVAFWTGSLGLARRHGDENWTELEVAGSTVALHGGHDGSRNATGLSLIVDDIEAAAAGVAETGGQVLQEPRDRPGEPIILANVVDTEGNEFSLTQMKDR